MARADLLKRLIQSYQKHDDRAFREAAEEIIAEERKKHHIVLANELERMLKNGNGHLDHGQLQKLAPPGSIPKDIEKGVALLELKWTNRFLDDLILSQEIRSALERVMREFREWEVLEANGLLPTRRVLFCGPSGCGKTAAAEAIAAELGLPLLYVRFDAVVSSLLGETAANLRRVFEYAQRGQWVMFFDEFDAIGRSRDDPTEHSEIKRVVNSYLQIVDNFTGRSLVIAATNFEQSLDPAAWRRFDDVIRFEKPTDEQIQRLVGKRLVPLKFSNAQVTEMVKQLSRSTYADAERVCLDIRKSCAIQGTRQVRKEDIAEALSRHAYRQAILEKASGNPVPMIDQD
ncbi:MAG TPA: ATP-binding protein [Leptolyngbyaceae cyanobacterium M33_DOE_097]|uniref:ATP-binding protein n=1 Tax=Oscillatoriales cyanobacterium SpSt-418 TaxID=2282169 RepID=A0A7C3PMQ5_9CYAN|nr:ATP-binding protein [Leptolyngbyaceae cyanobacterium M33_DOE_097]